MVWSLIGTAFWAMLPAYVPNNAAVLAGGGRPIDDGRTWGGRRLLGDGKTWRGTAVGTLAGVALALGLNAVVDPVGTAIGVSLPTFPLWGGVGLALGAMAGDIAASFIKRRSGRERGASFPGLDQLDFVVGALLMAVVLAPEWALATFTPGVLVVILVTTPLLHVGTNIIAYKIGAKDEPW
ncbi:CDP-2,3-bis-(O-geranylgeranyl)-sn-glycerol synthase [Halonotius terrestris]|uniref:CDP-archaeol synthase n=1 Tax=Halonotius terrestris TaxID=2487750 RepID=A0A8J8P9U8_9EURY|nr:CDP-2,3-bis-(O-geranylgeranyl)-sn-glycerol synthase [Halonotius terrestris]TQQ82889.1 CDP-2,3-bis-(O-geranylgeranyl)-sn-glycerol synthase [Halonotius terrestris]